MEVQKDIGWLTKIKAQREAVQCVALKLLVGHNLPPPMRVGSAAGRETQNLNGLCAPWPAPNYKGPPPVDPHPLC